MLERIGIAIAFILGTITFLLIALFVLGTLIGDGGEEAAVSTPAPTAAPTVVPTAVSRVWTVEELADCDTTTLSAQLCTASTIFAGCVNGFCRSDSFSDY